MNIKIYVKKRKCERFFLKAQAEYEKRLGRYCKIKIEEFKSADKLHKALEEEELIILLHPEGRSISSEELAEAIQTYEVGGVSRAAVVIDEDFPKDFRGGELKRVSISRMSLSEEMLRVVCLEQIYRGYKIIHKETYHK